MAKPYVVKLDAALAPVELVGGKGHNLLRLTAAGMPVPGGFVITTAAYKAWTCGKGKLPLYVTHELKRAYEAISYAKDTRVAVRSSAIAEDGGEASFAGGHETLLNVSGWPAVMEAIRACWASLSSERVRAYRERMGIGAEQEEPAIAVVVQNMVDARASGVLFTAEPVSGDRNRMALDAAQGLGEDLVSGKVIPEHWEIGRRFLRPTRVSNDGRCLSWREARRIAQCGVKIERHFGSPQDIEWSIDQKGELRILQSRPITATGNQQWKSPVEGAIWVRSGGGGLPEYLPGAVSPLYTTAQLPRIVKLLDQQCVEMGVVTPSPTMAVIEGHCYSRQDYRMGFGVLKLPFNYWRAGRTAAARWKNEVLGAQTAKLEELATVDITAASDSALAGHLSETLDHNARAWDNAVRASRAWVVIEPVFQRLYATLEPSKVDAVVFLRGFMSGVLAGECELYRLAESARETEFIARHLRMLDSHAALSKLKRSAKGREWLAQLSAYTERYGHMTPTQDYVDPSAADDPVKALEAVRARLDLTADPLVKLAQVEAERKQAEQQAMTALESHPVKRRVFQWILKLAQDGASIRENVFFHALAGWPLARRAMLELGARFQERGAIVVAEDIFFLEWDEVTALAQGQALDCRETTAGRRAEYLRQAELAPPASIPAAGAPMTLVRRIKKLLKQIIVGSSRESGRDFLRGSPVSPGQVTGIARILASASQLSELRAGDIVVTRAATPDWTPAFAVAAAFVSDTGGPLSHSSIIAREFGIPAVMGVQRATATIREGQKITVDGATGVIRLHEEEQHEIRTV